MAWYAIYETESGHLISGTNNLAQVANAAILTARGYSVATFPALNSGDGIWNPTTLTSTAPTPTAFMSNLAFLMLFPLAERVAWRGSTDPQAVDFLDLVHLMTRVDITGTGIVAEVNHLSTTTPAIITAARATAILTPV